jgi:hypothetical protein
MRLVARRFHKSPYIAGMLTGHGLIYIVRLGPGYALMHDILCSIAMQIAAAPLHMPSSLPNSTQHSKFFKPQLCTPGHWRQAYLPRKLRSRLEIPRQRLRAVGAIGFSRAVWAPLAGTLVDCQCDHSLAICTRRKILLPGFRATLSR